MSVPCEEAGPLQDFKPDNTGRRQHCVFDVGSAGGHLRVYAQEGSEAVATPLHLCNTWVLRLEQLNPLPA
jgi:hypothetical protein